MSDKMETLIPKRRGRPPAVPSAAPVPVPAPDPAASDQADLLRAENETLRARLAAMESAQNLKAVMAGVPVSHGGGPLAKYRVKLPGLNPRVVDDLGRVHYPDAMVVEGICEADAFARFCKLNGILSTSQTPSIEKVADQE